MFLQNKKYIKEILFIIPFKTGKIYTYRNTVYQYISDSKHGQGRRIKMRCPVKVLTGIFHPILLSAF